ncbi:MAG: ABC transporter permease [Eubacterium sp.]|nr:ABC transporter permease [Eubacterium sp.]
MARLLKFEFRKLFFQKSFYICGGISLILMIATMVISHMASLMIAEGQLLNPANDGVKAAVSAVDLSSIQLILPIFLPLYVCVDFTQGTIKNILARGFSRSQVLWSKYIVCQVAGLSIYAIHFVFALCLGSLLGGLGQWSLKALASLAVQTLVLTASISFYFMLCMLFQTMGASISLGILLPSVGGTILNVTQLLTEAYGMDLKIDLSYISVTGLTGKISDLGSFHKSDLISCLVVSLIYLFLTCLFSCVRMGRKEY